MSAEPLTSTTRLILGSIFLNPADVDDLVLGPLDRDRCLVLSLGFDLDHLLDVTLDEDLPAIELPVHWSKNSFAADSTFHARVCQWVGRQIMRDVNSSTPGSSLMNGSKM